MSGPGARDAHGPFAVTLTCTLSGKPVAGYPRKLSLTPDRPVTLTNVPVGAACTAKETGSGGATSTTIKYSDGAKATISTERAATITITNWVPAPFVPVTG